ncbi:MAG TPA: hypothetical protein PKX48_12040 [Planctomycetota bacterium]|jgi:hypothetical protein|nr:hypothetical protein [Planctomycetota bacterium]OQC22193.1 MAG: hypothetical protein BWX69_00044 [Planctomycetes bacterium ADurb.Bin069]NMD34531.1 hypothetical protein [Planctomycetota bacterium]HNS00037.1 hypothetical protein [Planctomycetota bacterium]HNU25376.1 hypothetical protein [Planctomycetota bacterium]
MAANDNSKNSSAARNGLKLKDGPYLTRKVERIMMHIARGRPVKWIAQLHNVRESVIYYVARCTGFSSSALVGRASGNSQKSSPGAR